MAKASLRQYARKRDFTKTAEPSPDAKTHKAKRGATSAARASRSAARSSLRFVVQKHAASHLHYDFRLELDGVLKSWAVPKGPSLNPADKRLAVQVEDHPVAYGDFEGTIPEGQYGGGTVMLWDTGRWRPVDEDAAEALRRGKLTFIVDGEKLKGEWTLTRMGGRAGNERKPNWLLIKKNDAEARATGSAITESETLSVKTGRDLDEIAAGRRARGTDRSRGRAAARPARRVASSRASRPSPTAGASTTRRGGKARVSVAGVAISNPDRVLFPEVKLTKLGLAEYYERVADLILPHVVDRPLSTVRCPSGRGGQCFFQKHLGETFSEPVRAMRVKEKDGSADYISIDSVEGLITLAQFGVLEIHPWGSRKEKLEQPDQLTFDLDPGEGVTFEDVKAGARLVREVLAEVELESFLKTSGGKGLHVIAPLKPKADWEEAKAFAHDVARCIAAREPERYLDTMSKQKRAGKIFVDYLRNGRGATSVAPYSARAREGAPVSMPIRWEDLGALRGPDQYTVMNAEAYLGKRRKDPWAGFDSLRSALTGAYLERMGKLAMG